MGGCHSSAVSSAPTILRPLKARLEKFKSHLAFTWNCSICHLKKLNLTLRLTHFVEVSRLQLNYFLVLFTSLDNFWMAYLVFGKLLYQLWHFYATGQIVFMAKDWIVIWPSGHTVAAIHHSFLAHDVLNHHFGLALFATFFGSYVIAV